MRKEPPSRNSISCWHHFFIVDGNLAHREGNGRPRTSAGTVLQVHVMFESQLRLSIRQTASTLKVSTAIVHHILKICLFLYPYKLQNFDGLLDGDIIKRLQFALHFQNNSEGYSEYFTKIVFPEKCIFRINGSVNRQNVSIWARYALLKLMNYL